MVVKMANDDLQSVWHSFVGNLFSNENIIDIGAGLGLSKKRMSVNGNKVTTQDIDRSLIDRVDIIEDTFDLYREYGDYTLLTMFDVIEHLPNPVRTISAVRDLTVYPVRMFVTTPNYYMYPRNWHYTPIEFLSIMYEANYYFAWCKLRLFLRYKGSDYDFVEEVDIYKFLNDSTSHALGIYMETK